MILVMEGAAGRVCRVGRHLGDACVGRGAERAHRRGCAHGLEAPSLASDVDSGGRSKYSELYLSACSGGRFGIVAGVICHEH